MSNEESPTVEEPTVPEAKEETTVDIDAIMGELQKAQIDNPEKLKGHLANARSYHQMQSERDRLAQELNAMRAEFTEMRETKRQPKQDYDADYDQSQPIDLEAALERAMERRERKNAQRQQQQQAMLLKTWNKINGHKYYNLVKEDFEEALRDPATAFRIQSGDLDAQELYYELLTDKFGGLTKKAVDAFTHLRGSGTVPPPHVESNARVGTQKLETKTDKEKKLEELAKKGKKPGGLKENELDDVLALALGDIL